jgi:hypothetical protein
VVMQVGERLGSGDGERKTLLTRQIAFEPLPAYVLFALLWPCVWCAGVMGVSQSKPRSRIKCSSSLKRRSTYSRTVARTAARTSARVHLCPGCN